jgi:hypothetical protein
MFTVVSAVDDPQLTTIFEVPIPPGSSFSGSGNEKPVVRGKDVVSKVTSVVRHN